MSKVTGKVAQIIGPVVDVEFTTGSKLPKIYDSLEVDNNGKLLILEVQSHVGEKPMKVEFKLETALPAELYEHFS